jgi:uncharacterized protein
MQDKKSNSPKKKVSKKSISQKAIALLFLVAFIVIPVLYYVNVHWLKKRTAKREAYQPERVVTYEPEFKKEGELAFIDQQTGDTLQHIDIEIADTPRDRAQGLMYRTQMGENQGMLFVFEEEEPQSFWMKNTKISLDIIFADANKKIVTIQKHTIPYSEAPVPSFEDAKYVVEVNAGFTDRYSIKEGDKIRF